MSNVLLGTKQEAETSGEEKELFHQISPCDQIDEYGLMVITAMKQIGSC